MISYKRWIQLMILSILVISTMMFVFSGNDSALQSPDTRSEPDRDGVISIDEYSGSHIIEDDVFEVYWTVSEERIYMGLKAKTTGWLSLGLDPSDGMMGADMIFGWVDGSGDAFMKDAYATDNSGSHPEDTTLGGSDDLESYDGSESGGWTTIEFRRDLNTGDSYDKQISTTLATDVLWGISSSDDWTSYHSSRGDDKITFTEGPPPPPPPGNDLDGVIETGEYDGMTTYNSGNFELHWSLDTTTITVGMKAQATGWISLGIGYTNKMKDSDMIFGWVDGSGVPGIADTYSTGTSGPHPADQTLGGTFDIISYNATETGGWTTVEFKRDLSTGDTYDNDIVTDSVMNVIWGVSTSDGFESMHSDVGYGTWELDPVSPPPPPTDAFDGLISDEEYGNVTKFDSDRFEIHWKIMGSSIDIGLKAQTTGYISLGIDPTTRMMDADVIIGGKDAQAAYIKDEFSTGETGPHAPDTGLGGSYDITSYNATESGGWTILEFRRDLDTGDTYDRVIPTTGEIPIMWSVGSSDDTGSMHARRGSGSWNLSGTPPPPPPPPDHISDLDGIITTDEYGNVTMFDSNRFELYWKVEDTDIFIGMKAEATGWISLGIDPTSRMDESDMLLGWVDADGRPHLLDMFSTGPTGPHPVDTDQGGTDDILDYNGTQENGWTTIELKRELSTGDTMDKDISTTELMTVIWGVSGSDDPSSMHTRRGTGSWKLKTDEGPGPEPGVISNLDGVISPEEYDDSAVFGNEEMTLHWKINGTKIQFAMEGDTEGWVSIGFEPSSIMKDADMIFGWVSSGTSYVLDTFSTGEYGPHPPDTDLGGTDDILDQNGTESGGNTVIEFIRDLDTKDEYDFLIPATGSINVIWAIGDSDDYLDSHSSRGFAAITMGENETPSTDEPDLDGIISEGEYDFKGSFGEGTIVEVHWKVDGDNISIGLVGKTSGWVSIGIGYSQAMADSDMIFGWVENDGTVKVVDAYSTGPTGPHPADTDLGGTDDILSFGGKESEGKTVIEFVRKLDTGDDRDNPIPTNGTIKIIWATGNSDNFNSIHSSVGYGTIEISTGETTSEDPVTLWPIHAFFMTLGVGGMIAATIVLYNKKNWKWFFKFHIWVMTGATISGAIGLITGFIMVEASTGSHMRVPHSWLGLLTLLVTFFSLGIGFYFKYTKKMEHKKITRKIHIWSGRVGVGLFILTAISGFIQAIFL